MNERLNRRQRINYFLLNLISFASIFLFLGIIVFQLLQTSIYKSVDDDLTRLSSNEQFIERELTGMNRVLKGRLSGTLDSPPPNNFQQQVVLWASDGTILNETALGSRINDFENLKLDTQQLNKITSVQLKDSNNRSLQFRSIVIPITDSFGTKTAYMQLLVNTDPIKGTVDRFKQILIMCMIIFSILSIVLSYFLSKWLMRPILISWKKQQEFVENASHELRTPLAIIQAKLEKLFTTPNKTILEESEAIALSLNEVERLSQLTNDLLLLARSDSNSIVMQKEELAANDFLMSVLLPYQELAEAEGKELTFDLEKNGPIKIDPRYIHQCIVILLDNALKYTSEGDQIFVSSVVTDSGWNFTLSDTGTGIDDEQKEAVFERFYRGEQSRNRKTGGYGIGLSIAKWIIDSHKGSIKLSDTKPKGTTVTIKIPSK